MQELIDEYTKSPYINGLIIDAALDHFRCHVLIRPAERKLLFCGFVSAPAKVAELDIEGLIK
jgi:hypothetical protein